MEAAAGVAVGDGGALAGQPRREDHVAAAGRDGGGQIDRGPRSRAGRPAGTTVIGATMLSRSHSKQRPAVSWLLTSRYRSAGEAGDRGELADDVGLLLLGRDS